MNYTKAKTRIVKLIFLCFLLKCRAFAQPLVTIPRFVQQDLKKNKPVSLWKFLGDVPYYGLPMEDCMSANGLFRFQVNKKGLIENLQISGSLPDTLISVIKARIFATEGHWLFPQYISKTAPAKWFVLPVMVDRALRKGCKVPDNNELYRWISQLCGDNEMFSTPYGDTYIMTPFIFTAVF